LYGTRSGTDNSTTDIEVAGGAGARAGRTGEVFIDGMNVTDDF
jgi:hypothetical protein